MARESLTRSQSGPFGSWNSPITADLVAREAVTLTECRVEPEAVYWIEGRPRENGRNVVVRSTAGEIADLTPSPYNARSQVHSYGGGAYTVHDGTVYFVHFGDGQLYRQSPGAAPAKLSTSPEGLFADICIDAERNRLIVVREQRPGGDVIHAINNLVAVDLGSVAEMTLDDGWDFYSSPALSLDRTRLAWLTWRHPYMPWISTYLHVADIDASGTLRNRRTIAGGPQISVQQPQWSADGKLFFLSDESGFWNLHWWNGSNAIVVLPRDADFGAPQWQFGISNFAFLSADTIIYSFTRNGMWYLGRLDLSTGLAHDYPAAFASVAGVRAAGGKIVLRYSTTNSAAAIGMLEVETGIITPLRHSVPPEIYEELRPYFSEPQSISFPTDGEEISYGFYYPPHNPDWQPPASEKAPLMVKSHGGPTSATTAELDLSVQFWTSRGFAVLDVNYRGSSGFGRIYREKLDGQWGIADVADCVAGAEFLIGRGEVDRAKLIIRGGSAGGYTTLCALTFRSVFAAGASYYGVSDLIALAADTHKFESHYLNWLIEPYRPESALYHDRSPIHFVERLSAPIIFLHGEEDPVVPLNQAKRMFAALQAKRIPTCLLVFQDEKHGFRQADHIRRALESELLFYGMNLLQIPIIA